MKKFLFLSMFLLLLSSCKKEAQEVYTTTNSEIRVDFLFEVDGVKVYRFYDNGHLIYFTNRTGETEYSYTTSNGRSPQTHRVQCLNNSIE